MQTAAKLILIISLFIWQKPGNQSLTNTKWHGTIYVPDASDGVLEFGKDTLSVYMDGNVLETMLYKENADTLSLKKISGGSPCGEETGLYKYEVKDNQLFVTPISDDCPVRAGAFSKDAYKKDDN